MEEIIRTSTLMPEESNLTEEEKEAVDRYFPICDFKKGKVLLSEGRVADDAYMVVSGCVRQYHVKDGEEICTEFYTEGMPIAPLASYTGRQPSKFFLECMEDCRLVVVNYHLEQELYAKYPKLGNLCRLGIEEEYGKQQEEMHWKLTSTPEEKYIYIMEKRPDLLNRVPQYQLASYLGIKPESLSRIRKRMATASRPAG